MAVSELGLMDPIMVQGGQAKVIKLFIFDGCGHRLTQPHIHAPTSPRPTSYHTPLLTPNHTNTPTHRAAGEGGSQYLRSRSYLASWSKSTRYCRQTIVISTMLLSAS